MNLILEERVLVGDFDQLGVALAATIGDVGQVREAFLTVFT
jgi:hypothetical protein